MDDNLTKILLAVVALLAAGAVITFKVIQNRNTHNSGRINDVTQKNIRAGGDVAGGDINKNTK
ncbi:hypothetical protein [Hymenobacter negativus]|uniref:YtxH domain-containing protein n=1 Tax=Hymenobacter negativus TaxID=2795026 RepID=A0ABS0Q5H1_9BACT|nr:hypothetical protein [Hymenobacter negativus]MBH8557909.1 hypothetical protein [Hymenobacter negativus]